MRTKLLLIIKHSDGWALMISVCYIRIFELSTAMKPIRQSKNEYIQMLIARGTPPIAETLKVNVSARKVAALERQLIAKHNHSPWNCNTAIGGEGLNPDARYCIYALKEPWPDGRTFYIGAATDVAKRLKQHIAEAKESCLILTKRPNLGVFLATFLNNCLGTLRVLESNNDRPVLRQFFYRTLKAYVAVRGNYCDPTDAVVLDCGWLVHKWLTKKEFLRIIATLHSLGGLFDRGPARARKL